MYYLLFCLFWLIGFVVFTFTCIQMMVIPFFGIPTTIKLNRLKSLKKNSIIRNYFISILILSAIFIGITYFVKEKFPTYFSAYIIGCVISLLFGIGKTGRNRNNIEDYLESNKKYLNKSNDEVLRDIFS
jgi:uncharacterized membrane protein YczE